MSELVSGSSSQTETICFTHKASWSYLAGTEWPDLDLCLAQGT